MSFSQRLRLEEDFREFPEMPKDDSGPPTMVVVKRGVDERELQAKKSRIDEALQLTMHLENSEGLGCSSTRDEDLENIVFSNGKRKKWLKVRNLDDFLKKLTKILKISKKIEIFSHNFF